MLLLLLLSTILISLFTLLGFTLKHVNILKQISLIFSSLFLMISALMVTFFNPNDSGYQFFFQLKNLRLDLLNIEFSFGVDGISIYFIFLTSFLIFLCVIFIWNETKFKFYILLLFFLNFLLILTFSVLNLFLFYAFFECILIPIYLIIGIWGSREKKIRASYLLVFYTIAGSLLMLLSIIYIYSIVGNVNMDFLSSYPFTFEQQVFIWFAFFLSFSSKIPMFPFHIWLPEAHVEAPTVGSVLLAGILLKLGVYGFLRYSLSLFPLASLYFSPFVFILSILGIVFASFAAIKQTDLKKIIAYSSIAHMNMVVLGLFSGSAIGLAASIFQSVSHGFVSSALFFIIGILYNQYHSRLIHYYSGLVSIMPLYSSFFLFFTMSNIGLPGTSSFIGEFLLLLGIFEKSFIAALLSTTSVVLSGGYSLWLYNRIVFGNIKSEFLLNYSDLNLKEFFILFFLFIPSLYLGFFPSFLLNSFSFSIINLVVLNNTIFI